METKEIKSKFEKYPEYRDSGVEWIGEIPKEWALLPNKYIFKLQKDLVGKNSNEYDLLSLTLNGIIKRDMINPQGKFPAEFDTYQKVNPNDFVFCLFDVEETPRCIGLSKFNGMITGAYTVMRSNSKLNKKFLYYFYLNLDSNKRLKPLYTGLRNTISKEIFFSLKTFVPPLSEQTAIANFLDKKTKEIDQAISSKEKLISLLQERKQIIIQNAVTHGLNPNVKFKDSGVEWIGMIPEHWEVKKIKYLGKIINGFAFSSNEFTDKGVRVMKIANIQTMKVDWSDESFINPKYYITHSQFRVKKGDLVFALTRPIILSGIKATIVNVDERILLNQRNALLQPFPILFKKWIYYILLNPLFLQRFDSEIDRTGQQPNISTISIGNIEISFPSYKEQKEISNYIDILSKKIDSSISLQQTLITKLKEYKQTLIDSAVTGKIKIQ